MRAEECIGITTVNMTNDSYICNADCHRNNIPTLHRANKILNLIKEQIFFIEKVVNKFRLPTVDENAIYLTVLF